MLHALDPQLDVQAAASGSGGLGIARHARPELVLLDIVMAEMDGWQVLETIKQDQAIADVPVYFVSAQDPTDQATVSEALLVTVDGGLSLSLILRCSLEIPRLLMRPD